MELSKELLLILMQICIDSYLGRHGKVKNVLKNKERFSVENVEVDIGELEGVVVASFPGSHGLMDWLDDFTFGKVKPEVYPLYFYEGMKVHEGFQDQMKLIAEVLEKAIGSLNQVIFTGHSLGGALATLFALAYADTCMHCATYGAPRVGNGVFAKTFNSKVKSSVRVLNGADSVGKVPFALPNITNKNFWLQPYWMNYRHVKGLIEIGQTLSWKEKALWLPREIIGNPLDHDPPRYLINLRKADLNECIREIQN